MKACPSAGPSHHGMLTKEAMPTVIVGADTHKRTHTFVAVDELGRKLAEKTVASTSDGHLDALAWASRWPQRRWALEDCRQMTQRLESDLLSAGEALVRVPTGLMAAERRGGRERGKSDPIDALAVARAALREDDLPVAHLDGPARELRLLVDHRDDLVAERTRIESRLRWHLHELFPEWAIAPRVLGRFKVLDDVQGRLAGAPGTVAVIAGAHRPRPGADRAGERSATPDQRHSFQAGT